MHGARGGRRPPAAKNSPLRDEAGAIWLDVRLSIGESLRLAWIMNSWGAQTFNSPPAMLEAG